MLTMSFLFNFQVRALYPFTGQGMVMAKGEVMFLMNKTNPDWWSVRKSDGTDGFVPANYVKEIEPKIVPVRIGNHCEIFIHFYSANLYHLFF